MLTVREEYAALAQTVQVYMYMLLVDLQPELCCFEAGALLLQLDTERFLAMVNQPMPMCLGPSADSCASQHVFKHEAGHGTGQGMQQATFA